eukprot:gnl/TRDRNA2_/TRDRNA2_130801_c0_seq1.p1 gnl/TRDRNA2_/TRDRNA2_130801_c0~~gnl/TRDRNA2_/TRDRNA2_130801_c0_seq1.p1  ORF type:complete len:562 (+),score=116.77 gnl/TRDRNA2_/TRDRNA2_130801_c0_seq1:109-1686(+)
MEGSQIECKHLKWEVTKLRSGINGHTDAVPTAKIPTRISVKNLPWTADEDSIWRHFSDAGKLVKVEMHRDSAGYFRGAASVEFATTDAAKRAVGHPRYHLFNRRQITCEPFHGKTLRSDDNSARTSAVPRAHLLMAEKSVPATSPELPPKPQKSLPRSGALTPKPPNVAPPMSAYANGRGLPAKPPKSAHHLSGALTPKPPKVAPPKSASTTSREFPPQPPKLVDPISGTLAPRPPKAARLPLTPKAPPKKPLKSAPFGTSLIARLGEKIRRAAVARMREGEEASRKPPANIVPAPPPVRRGTKAAGDDGFDALRKVLGIKRRNEALEAAPPPPPPKRPRTLGSSAPVVVPPPPRSPQHADERESSSEAGTAVAIHSSAASSRAHDEEVPSSLPGGKSKFLRPKARARRIAAAAATIIDSRTDEGGFSVKLSKPVAKKRAQRPVAEENGARNLKVQKVLAAATEVTAAARVEDRLLPKPPPDPPPALRHKAGRMHPAGAPAPQESSGRWKSEHGNAGLYWSSGDW